MGCNCGGKKQNVDYLITFRHDGSVRTVSSLPDVRRALSESPSGGTYKAVPRK